jgi:hypothetical protein
MRITILNGATADASPFDTYVHEYASRLGGEGNDVTVLDLREMHLSGCSGCFGCWVKTPGECVKHDDSAIVCRNAVASDLVVFASPLVMGFTNALTKRTADQMIPILHPGLVIEGGEMHHRARYDRYPELALLLDVGPDSDVEDVEITTAIWSRTARNMKSRLAFTAVADRPAEEVAHEFASVA